MSNELHIEEGYQHFVSPKRKRMMSPNNCIKISKDQGSTHVQKHRETGHHDFSGAVVGDGLGKPIIDLVSSTSGSPSTNCFIRKPNNGSNRREDFNASKFGSLKKGNLFGESDGLGCYSTDDDFDDVDADEKFDRRLRDNQPSERALALKKSFTYGRNFVDAKGSSLHDTDHEQHETDAGTESDFSGVAGKMSTLSVGKRASGFNFPGRRGSPGSSPASSQNSSVNSSIALSPALLMDDLLSADASSAPRRTRQADARSYGLFHAEELPSRNMRSRANRLITSAILNSNSSSNFSVPPALGAMDSPAPLGAVHNHASVLHSSASSMNTHINKFHMNGSGMANHSDTDVLYTSSASTSRLHDHSMNSSSSGDSFHQRHQALEYSGTHSGLKSENGAYCHDDDERHHQLASHQQHSSLPPRTPLVHKSGGQAHAHLHGAAELSSLQRIDEAPRQVEEEDSYSAGRGLAYDAYGSPILTPSRGRRRRTEGSQSQSGVSMSQQSHEAAMGDLGTPVTEVGSPAVLDGMDDLVGEDEDSNDDMNESPDQPRIRLNSSLLMDDRERDDPELVMITMRGSDSHEKVRDRRHPRRKISSPSACGGSTAGPKGRLFAEDSHLNEDDHQYHLFAQRFMVSPTADDLEEMNQYGRGCSPLPHKSRQVSRDRQADTVLDSSADSSTTMSFTRTNSDVMSLNRTNSMSLTRTGSDILMLSKNSSHNSSSNCMDLNSDCNTSNTGTSSAFLPLPDQSAFDGPAHADLSRSSYEISNASIDPLFPTPGSARKKRAVQAVGSPIAGGGPPTPLKGLDWGLLGVMSPSVDLKHSHRNLKQEAQDQLNATSRSSADSTPHVMQGIAMPSSESSTGSAGSHDSDILVHNWHHKGGSTFDASSDESKDPSHQSRYQNWDNDASPNDSFTSLSARPTLVRQSSLLDTKLLLSQTEDHEHRHSMGAATVTFRSDFEEVGLLGSGTFADVYKVRQVTPGSDPSVFFAVKKSKRQFKSKRDREWLMAEVRTMKLVGQQSACAYVVPFIRAWQEDSYFYVQMGFAERGTLRELLVHLATPSRRNSNNNNVNNINNITSSVATNGALVPDNTLWHVVHDVTAGLRHVHECGMVHLDIKPANLLITEHGTVQIGDFGMAAPIGSSEDGHEGDTR